MKNQINFWVILRFTIITIMLLSCKKNDITTTPDPASGQFDGIYFEDEINPNLGLITGSKFIYLYFDDDYFDNYSTSWHYSYLSGYVGIDGSVVNHSTIIANGINVEINLNAFINNSGKMSGSLKATALGKTSDSSVSLQETDSTKSESTGSFDGFYAGQIKEPWINSTEDAPFIAVVYGNVIYVKSYIMGIIIGTLSNDGSFSLNSEHGYFKAKIDSSGIVNGIFQYKEGENEDKFQITGAKENI